MGCLWFLFVMPSQVEKRLRSLLGEAVCKDWNLQDVAQKNLTTFSVGKLVVPASPVIEARDFLVISNVELAASEATVPGFGSGRMAITVDGGEIHLERSNNFWNIAGVSESLLSICRNKQLKGFSCPDGVFLLSIRQQRNKKDWHFQLRNLSIENRVDDVLALKAQVFRSKHPAAWERGALEVEMGLNPMHYLLQFNAYHFPGVNELSDLFLGPVDGVQLAGEGNLTITGQTDKAGMDWKGLLQATGLSMRFPGTGMVLEDLEGLLVFRRGRIHWSALSGTLGGIGMTAAGALDRNQGALGAPQDNQPIRLTFDEVPLSSAWLKLLKHDGLRGLFARLRPQGKLKGTLQLRNMLVRSQETVSAAFSSESLGLGENMAMQTVQVSGDQAKGSLVQGEMAWEGLTLAGCTLGAGSLEVVRDDTGWVVNQCILGYGESGKIIGQGRLTMAPTPEVSMRFTPCELALDDLFTVMGIRPGLKGRAEAGQGALAVRYDASGFQVQGGLGLKNVGFDTFLQGLKAHMPEGAVLDFTAGRVSFRLDRETLTLSPALFFSSRWIVYVQGTLTAPDSGDLKLLVVDRGQLLDDVIITGEPGKWPLSEEQRNSAVQLRLKGPVSGDAFTPLEADDVFLQKPEAMPPPE